MKRLVESYDIDEVKVFEPSPQRYIRRVRRRAGVGGRAMKQFGKILKFELKGYFKNKAFTGVTIFLVVAIAVAMFIPNIISAFKTGATPSKDLPVMLVVCRRRNPF